MDLISIPTGRPWADRPIGFPPEPSCASGLWVLVDLDASFPARNSPLSASISSVPQASWLPLHLGTVPALHSVL